MSYVPRSPPESGKYCVPRPREDYASRIIVRLPPAPGTLGDPGSHGNDTRRTISRAKSTTPPFKAPTTSRSDAQDAGEEPPQCDKDTNKHSKKHSPGDNVFTPSTLGDGRLPKLDKAGLAFFVRCAIDGEDDSFTMTFFEPTLSAASTATPASRKTTTRNTSRIRIGTERNSEERPPGGALENAARRDGGHEDPRRVGAMFSEDKGLDTALALCLTCLKITATSITAAVDP
eukprot:jgi/Undpi1/8258/HiC_scaffold_25.g10728.m1